MTAATIRMTTITAVSCSHKMRQGLLSPRSINSLGPYLARRRRASAWVSPVPRVRLQSKQDTFSFQAMPISHLITPSLTDPPTPNTARI